MQSELFLVSEGRKEEKEKEREEGEGSKGRWGLSLRLSKSGTLSPGLCSNRVSEVSYHSPTCCFTHKDLLFLHPNCISKFSQMKQLRPDDPALLDFGIQQLLLFWPCPIFHPGLHTLSHTSTLLAFVLYMIWSTLRTAPIVRMFLVIAHLFIYPTVSWIATMCQASGIQRQVRCSLEPQGVPSAPFNLAVHTRSNSVMEASRGEGLYLDENVPNLSTAKTWWSQFSWKVKNFSLCGRLFHNGPL